MTGDDISYITARLKRQTDKAREAAVLEADRMHATLGRLIGELANPTMEVAPDFERLITSMAGLLRSVSELETSTRTISIFEE